MTTLRSIQASVNSKLVYKKTPVSEDVIRSAFSGRIQSSAKDLLAEFQDSTNKLSLISKIKTVDGDLYRKVATLSTSNEQQAVQEAVKGLIELASVEVPDSEPIQTTDGEVPEGSSLPETEPAVTDEEIKDANTALAAEEQQLPTEESTTEENLESSNSNTPPGEQIRSGFYNSVNPELNPDVLPKQTIIDGLFGNLKIDSTYNPLNRIVLGTGDQAGIFAFYFEPETEIREFIEPLSTWLYTHQYPQLGFLKVDRMNNALLYQYREGDSNILYTTDQSVAPIQSSVNVAATQVGDIAQTTTIPGKKSTNSDLTDVNQEINKEMIINSNAARTFHLGDEVQFRHAGGRLSPELATIIKENPDGTFRLRWEDSDISDGVDGYNLVLTPRKLNITVFPA